MNILEYIDYLVEDCKWDEEAANTEAARVFGVCDEEGER